MPNDPNGWGGSPYGVSPYGAGSSAFPEISLAWAPSTHTVIVHLDGDPHPDHVLDPAYWTLIRDGSGAAITIQLIIARGNGVYELSIAHALDSYPLTHTVSTTVPGLGGTPSPVSSYQFLGIGASIARRSPSETRDIRNPQIPLTDREAAVLRVSSSADYETHSGQEFLLKLILRRLTVLPSGFLHLTEYGDGLRSKEPIAPGRLVQIRREAELALASEPEFSSVRVGATISSEGILRLTISATLAETRESTTFDIAVGGPDE